MELGIFLEATGLVVGVLQLGITGFLSYKILELTRRDIENSFIEIENVDFDEVHYEDDEDISPDLGMFVTLKNTGEGDGKIRNIEVKAKRSGEETSTVEDCHCLDYNYSSSNLSPGETRSVPFMSNHPNSTDFYLIKVVTEEREKAIAEFNPMKSRSML